MIDPRKTPPHTRCMSILAALLAMSAIGVSCSSGDRRAVRMNRPMTSSFSRTTEPTQNQAMEIIAGEHAIDAGEYQKAIALFEALLSENPTLTDAYLGLGAAKLQTGDLAGAEVSYSRAARLEPTNYDAQLGHAEVLEALNRSADAMEAYRRALALNPQSIAANEGLATACIATNRPQDAFRYAERAVQLQPESVEARIRLAEACERLGKLDQAISAYETALELGETTEAMLHKVIAAYMAAKRWQEAANAAGTLVKIAPKAESYERLGRAFFRLGKHELSMDAYREAVVIDPEHWPSLNGLGVNALNAWLRSGRADNEMALVARNALNDSLRLNPAQPKLVEILTSFSL